MIERRSFLKLLGGGLLALMGFPLPSRPQARELIQAPRGYAKMGRIEPPSHPMCRSSNIEIGDALVFDDQTGALKKAPPTATSMDVLGFATEPIPSGGSGEVRLLRYDGDVRVKVMVR